MTGKPRTGHFQPDWIVRLDGWRRRRLAVINILAPVYFFLFTLGRVYAETSLLAASPFFSYYTACHHMLWFAGVFLSIILAMHFILQIALKDLVILAYGVTLTGFPLLFALLTGSKLELAYLRGNEWEIFTHILSFVWTYQADRPLTGELILIFTGVGGLAYLLTRSAAKALLTSVASHAVIMAWAVHWVGNQPHPHAIFGVRTWMVSNCLISITFLYVITALAFLALHRAGLLARGAQAWMAAAAAGAAGWGCFSLVVWKTGWFVLPFDVIAAGLPIFMNVFLLAACLNRNRYGLSVAALGVFGLLFAVHVAVTAPLLVHAEDGLITEAERFSRIKRLEALPFPGEVRGPGGLPGRQGQ